MIKKQHRRSYLFLQINTSYKDTVADCGFECIFMLCASQSMCVIWPTRLNSFPYAYTHTHTHTHTHAHTQSCLCLIWWMAQSGLFVFYMDTSVCVCCAWTAGFLAVKYVNMCRTAECHLDTGLNVLGLLHHYYYCSLLGLTFETLIWNS